MSAPDPFPVAPYVLGAAALVAGAVVVRGDVARARGTGRLLALGPLFVAAPMAAFGGDHFTFANIAQIVPAWIPWHTFWRLFVGACLVAGGFAIALRIKGNLALALFGTMMWSFVVLMHIPAALGAPGDRFAWAVLSRDSTFGAGVIALAATRARASLLPPRAAHAVARILLGIAPLFWAAEQLLHPDYRPGITLRQLNPFWLPLQVPLAWVCAAVLTASGLLILSGKEAKRGAIGLGVLFLVLAVVLGIPITVAAPADIGGLNYVFDDLMMSGVALCLAAALGRGAAVAAEVRTAG